MKKAYPANFLDLKSQPRHSLLMSDESNDYLYTLSNTDIQTYQVDNLSQKLAEVHYP